MTNVSTLGGLVFFLVVFIFIPFWSAFIISYASYRKIRAGVVGGLTGLTVFILLTVISLPLKYGIWVYGLVSGLIGGIAAVGYLSRYYQPYLPTKWSPKIFLNWKNVILVVVVLVLLFSLTQYYSFARKDLEFSITDPRGDISHSGYGEQKLSGHDDIDIVRLESHISGSNVILEMEIAGEIGTDAGVEYTLFIATYRQGIWDNQINFRDMEKNGRTLRAKIPIETLSDRKIFHVLAVASKPYTATDRGLYDNCSNRNIIEDILSILI